MVSFYKDKADCLSKENSQLQYKNQELNEKVLKLSYLIDRLSKENELLKNEY